MNDATWWWEARATESSDDRATPTALADDVTQSTSTGVDDDGELRE